MKSTEHIDLILFDLGGVLIHFTGTQKMLEWTRGKMTEPELIKWYFNSPAVRGFETGIIKTDEFVDLILSELDLAINKNEFIKELSSWFLGPYPGTKELLAKLTDSYKLATLSNTNELFWEMFKITDIYELFQCHFPSFKIGHLKPDPRIFQHVLDSTGLKPERILFFDDSLPNVESAQKFGIRAYKVAGYQELKAVLNSLDLS